jgi:hypothetical protein
MTHILEKNFQDILKIDLSKSNIFFSYTIYSYQSKKTLRNSGCDFTDDESIS